MLESLVGLWWYTDDGELWAVTRLTQSGFKMYINIKYDFILDHSKIWKKVVKEHVPDEDTANQIIARGWKSFEYGSVEYNTVFDHYEITCSRKIALNTEIRQKIIDAYHLQDGKYTFLHDPAIKKE